MFINRTFAPSFDELQTSLLYGISAGILTENDGIFRVTDSWYEQIHRHDDSSSNEIDSLLKFEDELTSTEWEASSSKDFLLTHDQYDRAVRSSKLFPSLLERFLPSLSRLFGL
jgi:hypothetical protein